MDWRVGRASGDWPGSCKVCGVESDGKEGQITPLLLPSPGNWQKGKGKRDGMGDPGGKQFSKSPHSWLLIPLGFPSTCLGHALSAQHATDNHSQLLYGFTTPPFEHGGFSEKSLDLLSRRVDSTLKGRTRVDGCTKERKYSYRGEGSGRGLGRRRKRVAKVWTDVMRSDVLRTGNDVWRHLFRNYCYTVSCRTLCYRSTAFSKNQCHFSRLWKLYFCVFECWDDP